MFFVSAFIGGSLDPVLSSASAVQCSLSAFIGG
jgi:hypothetical protein